MKEYKKPILWMYLLPPEDVITESVGVSDDEKDTTDDPYGKDWFN